MYEYAGVETTTMKSEKSESFAKKQAERVYFYILMLAFFMLFAG